MEESTPQTTYPFQTLNQPLNKSGNKSSIVFNILKILGIIAVLGLLTGVGLLYARVYDPLWNPFRPEPKEVFERMTEKMKEIKSYHIDIDAEMIVKNKSEFNINGKIKSDIDINDPKNPKTSGNTNLNFIMEGMQFSSDLENIGIGKTFFIKFITIPALPMFQPIFQIMGIDLNELKNQWVKIDDKTNDEISKKLLGKKHKKYKKQQTENEKQEKKIIEEFKKIIENKKFYLIKKELPDEEIGQTKVYHYIVSLNKEEIKTIVPDLINTLIKFSGETNFSATQKEESLKEFDEFFERIGELQGELWIGKKDNLLYRFKGEKNFDLSQFEDNEKGTILIRIKIDGSKFNQPIKIEAPENYKNLEDIFSLPQFMIPQSLKLKTNQPVF